MVSPAQHPLAALLQKRIAIIDGAMGTTIRTYGMKEADIRRTRFADSKKDLLNNGDLFSLTQPKMIGDIHRRFLEAGADIIETNTFGATSIGQSEFFVDDPREHGGRKDADFYAKIIDDKFLNDLAWEINEQSARQCREWADKVGSADGKQRFVAGSIGPLTVSLSNSPDADDAGFRVVTFDQVKKAYIHQIRALIAGGSDVLLVETIFALPGLGTAALDATNGHDFPVLQGVVLYFTLMVVIVNLLLDAAYAWLNPKVVVR